MAENLPVWTIMANSKPLPYWLSGGTESCDLCEQPHTLQSQRRCAACDRASCEHCITGNRETGEVLCHECHAAESSGEDG